MGSLADLLRPMPYGGAFGTGTLEEEGSRAPNPVANLLLGIGSSLASLPRRAIENSQFAVNTGHYDPHVPVETAMTLAGGGLPMAEKGAAGIFGGRLAKTADHTALARAEEMAASGAPREAIHAETGWFQGPDQKWRFEIPDNASKVSERVANEFNARPVGDSVPVQNADRFLDHPELFQAYPDLWRVNTRLEKGGGYPYRPAANYSVRESGAENIGVNAASLGQANSMALHEFQHAIQSREGFAHGADARIMSPDHYNRTAGEVEAYNVQRRKDMTAAERSASPPWMTQDVPYDQQIIRLLLGDN